MRPADFLRFLLSKTTEPHLRVSIGRKPVTLIVLLKRQREQSVTLVFCKLRLPSARHGILRTFWESMGTV